MRNFYHKLKQDDQDLLDAAAALGARDGFQATSNNLSQGIVNENNGIGEIQDRGHFGLGIAPRESRPVHKIELTKQQEAEINEA